MIDGLPAEVSEDRLKAISAASAAAGAVSMFHAVGITPEAETLAEAFQVAEFDDSVPEACINVTPAMLVQARDMLTNTESAELRAVCLGTPHFSVSEFAQLMPLIEAQQAKQPGITIHEGICFYISTSRFILAEIEQQGWVEQLEAFGVTMVVDTCTYFTPIAKGITGGVMTNSGKWAYYAPGMLKVPVVFGSMAECVESAVQGRVWRDAHLWKDDLWSSKSAAPGNGGIDDAVTGQSTERR